MPPDNNQQPLDPSIVALTKAIGQAESGGSYNAPSGDPGSLPSAYQFTPGFTDKWGPKVLGANYQPGQQLSPAQQDELAYGVVKTMGTSGDPAYPEMGALNPAQITSAWNTGNPNAYLDHAYGQNNKYGSTWNYVNKVGDLYQKNMGGSSSQDIGSALNKAFNPFATGPGSMSSDIQQNIGTAGPAALGAAVLGPIAGTITGGSGLLGGALKLFGLDKVFEGATGLYNSIFGGSPPSGNSSQQNPPDHSQSSMSSELLNLANNSKEQLKAAQDLTNTTAQALGGTVGGAQLGASADGKQGLQTIGQYNYAPTIDSFGRMDYTGSYQNAANHVGELDKQAQENFSEEGGSVPMKEAVAQAKENMHQFTPKTQWAEGDKEIEELGKVYQDKQGNISLAELHRAKKETGFGKKWGLLESSAKKEAYKSFSQAAKSTALKHTKHPELYKAILKEEQKIINARKIMKRLHGKKAPAMQKTLPYLLSREARKIIGGYIGNKIGGPIGAAIGYVTSEHLIRALDKKHGLTIFDSKPMKKSLETLKKKSPEAYNVIMAEVERAKKEHKSPAAQKQHFEQAMEKMVAGAKGKIEEGKTLKIPERTSPTPKHLLPILNQTNSKPSGGKKKKKGNGNTSKKG